MLTASCLIHNCHCSCSCCHTASSAALLISSPLHLCHRQPSGLHNQPGTHRTRHSPAFEPVTRQLSQARVPARTLQSCAGQTLSPCPQLPQTSQDAPAAHSTAGPPSPASTESLQHSTAAWTPCFKTPSAYALGRPVAALLAGLVFSTGWAQVPAGRAAKELLKMFLHITDTLGGHRTDAFRALAAVDLATLSTQEAEAWLQVVEGLARLCLLCMALEARHAPLAAQVRLLLCSTWQQPWTPADSKIPGRRPRKASAGSTHSWCMWRTRSWGCNRLRS